MEIPRYTITERLLGLLEKVAAISSKISESRLRFPVRLRLEQEAVNQNTHSSTSIEGNPLSLKEVAALGKAGTVLADDRSQREVLNYFKALRWMLRESRKPLDEKKLLRLHALMMQGLLSADKAGRYKQKQNYVVDARGRVVYTPSSPQQTPSLTRQLLSWAAKSRGVHPVIASAVFHHGLVSIHPFSDGNGRAARAGAQWILYWRGFDPWHFYAIDDFYAQDRGRYYEKIQQARELDGDLTYWIEYTAEGLLAAAERVWEKIRGLSRPSGEMFILTPKQEALLGILRQQNGLGSQNIGKKLKVNRARVHQLTAPLVKAGILKSEGRARAVRYYL